MTDTLRERALAAIQEATRCWKMCGPPPRPPCRCEQARDAVIALVLEEAAKVVGVKLFNRSCTCNFEVAAAIRALKEDGDGK